MEFEQKIEKIIVGYFMASLVIGIVAYTALLFHWPKMIYFFYKLNSINWY